MTQLQIVDPEPPDAPLGSPTAEDIKDALRRRHHGQNRGRFPGQWTCIEEWLGIDLLALNAWSKADVVGYEVKISRSDLRRELLKPHKRTGALAVTTEFYLAVPAGLLTDNEIAYEEPEWNPADFLRVPCPGIPEFGPEPHRRDRWGHRPYGGRCHRYTKKGQHVVAVPVPEVGSSPKRHRVVCWTCGGRGYLERSRVEREAPTCWVPRDVGLVTVSRRGCQIVKPSPRRKNPESIASTRKALNTLVRWVSHRPDPRHQ